MKKKIIFALLPVAAMSLTSCGAVLDYKANLDKYVFEMAYHEDFNILQMTDIHWNYNSSTMRNKQYLDKVFKQTKDHLVDAQGSGAKIDLVELTGDQFMLSNSYHVKSFIEYFEKKAEEYGFMYTVIWGNHDRHGLYNPNWLAEQFAKAKHCYYVELDDNLYGRSNFVINLNQAGKPVWQLYNLDSGASFSETSVSPFRDYDYIRKDQTDWFLKEHDYAKDLAGKEVPSIAYYHIPQQDNGIAWEKVLKDKSVYKNKFFKLEVV